MKIIIICIVLSLASLFITSCSCKMKVSADMKCDPHVLVKEGEV